VGGSNQSEEVIKWVEASFLGQIQPQTKRGLTKESIKGSIKEGKDENFPRVREIFEEEVK